MARNHLPWLFVALGCGCTGAGDGDIPPPPAGPTSSADLATAPPDLAQPVSAADLGHPPVADLATPPPTKKVLDFTWQGQETNYYCGPASTRIALTTQMANPPSQTTLAAYLGTTTNGTDDISLVRGALNHYLGTTWFETKYLPDPPSQVQRDLLKHDVVFNIDRGYPLVANVVSGWRPPGYPTDGTIYHYVAIVGYDQGGDLVLIGDPAGWGDASPAWTTVPHWYWISVYDLGTWIGGKGYTA
jgi:hypothetical protein